MVCHNQVKETFNKLEQLRSMHQKYSSKLKDIEDNPSFDNVKHDQLEQEQDAIYVDYYDLVFSNFRGYINKGQRRLSSIDFMDRDFLLELEKVFNDNYQEVSSYNNYQLIQELDDTGNVIYSITDGRTTFSSKIYDCDIEHAINQFKRRIDNNDWDSGSWL